MTQYNCHPIIARIVCLAESYRELERMQERGSARSGLMPELHATRRMLDDHIREWRKAIDDNPSAFAFMPDSEAKEGER